MGKGKAFRITISGRNRWVLDKLRKIEAQGCTPIQKAAPRWAANVHTLRDLVVGSETADEAHEGDLLGASCTLCAALGRVAMLERGCGMSRLQLAFLMRAHGLTEAQTHALAALIWGAF